MRKSIKNNFFMNYIVMLLISIVVFFIAILMLSFANDVIKKNLVKNQFTAEELMRDDYNQIDWEKVIENGGGIQVINQELEIVYSKGIDVFGTESLTTDKFTEFLTESQSIHATFSHSIAYNDVKDFWLIVTFPTSLRIDFAIAHNPISESVESEKVFGIVLAIVLFYLLLLYVSSLIFSKFTSVLYVKPILQLKENAQRLKSGDYSSRVSVNREDEIGELGITFNEMAEKIETEMRLRKKSEENRRNLVLDISHDLKNPLASIMGYAEYCMKNKELGQAEKDKYLQIIYNNSVRTNQLIMDLFELSKLDSTDYVIHKQDVDICEFVRKECATMIPLLDEKGFYYNFLIPEKKLSISMDEELMRRVFGNLIDNALKYNESGTTIEVLLVDRPDCVEIIFADNGRGLPKEMETSIFSAFKRVDDTRNSDSDGSGLGLAIVEKIIKAHEGNIKLETDIGKGCRFKICLTK